MLDNIPIIASPNVVQVYNFYLDKAIQIAQTNKGATVLKTDCHNESNIYTQSKPIIPHIWNDVNVFSLEQDASVIKKALHNIGNKNWVVKQGDIRNIPYDNDQFDILMDFSTIDHVCADDLPKVVAEYKRVTKPSAKFMIVVWTDSNRKCARWPGQFFFSKDYFENQLNKHNFTIKSYNLLWKHPENHNEKLYIYEGVVK